MKKKKSIPFSELLTDIYLCLLGSVFILYVGAKGYADLQAAKYNLFTVLSGGYLIALALLGLETRIIGGSLKVPRKPFREKIRPVHLLIVAYWLVTALSTLCSPYRRQALVGISRNEGFLTISLYCATFLCVSLFARPKPWLKWVLGGTMTVFGAICVLQLLGKNPLHLYPAGLDYYDANLEYAGIYLGTTGNAGLTAALQTLTIPILLTAALRGKEKLRWLLLLPVVLNAAVLFKVQIQAGMLALLVGLVLGLPVVLPLTKKRRCLAFALVGVALVAGLTAVLMTESTSGTVYELREVLHGNFDSDFGNGRLYIWKEVLARIPEQLWLGTGPDTMAAAGITGYTWTPWGSTEAIPLVVDTAHNDYLNILFHQGAPALAVYLAALLWTAVGWIRKSAASPPAAALGLGLLCYAIQAFFSFSMCHAAALFWAGWALLDNAINSLEVQS